MRGNVFFWPVVGLLVAGCGNGGYDRSDGSFDRQGFHNLVIQSCGQGLASNPDAESFDRDAICACVAERLIEGKTDAELREQVPLQQDHVLQTMEQCASNTRRLVFDPATGSVIPKGQ